MLLKCTRSGGTTLWSVADTQFKREVGTSAVGIMGGGHACLVFDASIVLDAFNVPYYKIFFDGKAGYVRADLFEPIEQ
jgi:hypothetical protein